MDLKTLEGLSKALFGVKFGRLNSENRLAVTRIAVDVKRNDILSDIVTTLDRIQNDTGSIATVIWDKS